MLTSAISVVANGSGIHNIIEPLVANSQVIIGPKYQKFAEARWLVDHSAIHIAHMADDITSKVLAFTPDSKKLNLITDFINSHSAAVTIIETNIAELLENRPNYQN